MEADLQTTKASKEWLRAAMEVSQQTMWATIRACQKNTEVVVNTILYKFEETINKQEERVLAICQTSIRGLRPTCKQ
jgi:hypothetical protein